VDSVTLKGSRTFCISAAQTLIQTGYLAYKKHPPPKDPTVALCLGPYRDPMGVGVSYERGTSVLKPSTKRRRRAWRNAGLWPGGGRRRGRQFPRGGVCQVASAPPCHVCHICSIDGSFTKPVFPEKFRCKRSAYRCRANMARMTQLRPDSDLGFQAKVLKPY